MNINYRKFISSIRIGIRHDETDDKEYKVYVNVYEKLNKCLSKLHQKSMESNQHHACLLL